MQQSFCPWCCEMVAGRVCFLPGHQPSVTHHTTQSPHCHTPEATTAVTTPQAEYVRVPTTTPSPCC